MAITDEEYEAARKEIASLQALLGMHLSRIEELEAERVQLRSKLDFILGHIYAIGKEI